jgi:hypothetical protein
VYEKFLCFANSLAVHQHGIVIATADDDDIGFFLIIHILCIGKALEMKFDGISLLSSYNLYKFMLRKINFL